MKSDSDLSDSSPALAQIIRDEIESVGPTTFARFMELALYHPQHGYYASGRARIGRQGDFFTNVSVGPAFGKLLAAQFLEIWEKLERPRPFTIVEQGAQDGRFAADVFDALSGSECLAALGYIIIEPFPVWQKRQKETLDHVSEKTSWRDSIDQLDSFTGVHFSNELFDALPVHLIESEGSDWKELFVELSDAGFQLQKRACSGGLRPPKFAPRAGIASAVIDHRYRTEAHLLGPKLMREIASKLSRGVILTIDYGFTRDEFYSPERSAGTLQIRAQHRKLASPFEQIGFADISAHVEWTSLIEGAQLAGAKFIGLTDQHHFLSGILTELFSETALTAADKRALQTLLHPEMLGRAFQALALGKNFSGQLSGFRFGRALQSCSGSDRSSDKG